MEPPAGASDQNPAFSPDGSRIVFTRFDHGYNEGPAGLFLLTAGIVGRVTPAEDQDNVNLPGAAWSAARNRIVFASDRSDAADLWWIAPDGGDLHRITDHGGPEFYYEPNWSPDGAWICFEVRSGGDGEGSTGAIWKVRADGSAAVALTGGGLYDDRQPNWSPNDDRIVFQRRNVNGETFRLVTIDADGGNVVEVTDGNSDDTDASWSPDGERIVYSSDREGQVDLWIVSRLGGTPQMVTNDPSPDGAASWSPDGRHIAFESHADEDGPASLWQIDTPSHQRWFLAGVAHTPGAGGSTWRSDVWIVNRNATPVEVELTTTAVSGPVGRVVVPADGSVGWRDVLVELFGLDGSAEASGAMVITAPAPLAIVARTYNLSGIGTYGQLIPAVRAVDAVRSGEIATIPGLDTRGDFRVNVGVINLGDESSVASVRTFNDTGFVVDTRLFVVDPGRWQQANDVLAGRSGVFFADVEVTDHDGPVWAYASVIDNGTGDATLIPMQRLD